MDVDGLVSLPIRVTGNKDKYFRHCCSWPIRRISVLPIDWLSVCSRASSSKLSLCRMRFDCWWERALSQRFAYQRCIWCQEIINACFQQICRKGLSLHDLFGEFRVICCISSSEADSNLVSVAVFRGRDGIWWENILKWCTNLRDFVREKGAKHAS